ncbi:NAD(+)/NADH kinase [Candidatus Peregrinibacteria bacterium]|nr:NAD(+)/NADH kinase [Candidatus Peregrinibacteria bacterium]
MRKIKNIAIIGKQELIGETDLMARIRRTIKSCNCKIIFTGADADAKSLQKCDIVLTIGGDGTVLRVAREIAGLKHKPFIVGVHVGIVGFLAELTPANIENELKSLIKGDYREDKRKLLEVEIFRGNASAAGKKIFKSFALNDAVINQGPFARMLNLTIHINEKIMSEFRGDGVIVATTTGSTGHSLAAGGSIIHPSLDTFIITPLCPASLSMRPIIIPDSRTITIELTGRKPLQTEVRLTVDGQNSIPIRYGDKVLVKRTNSSITFLRSKDKNFYATLRQKLHWGERHF